jgi:hypothetical protein
VSYHEIRYVSQNLVGLSWRCKLTTSPTLSPKSVIVLCHKGKILCVNHSINWKLLIFSLGTNDFFWFFYSPDCGCMCGCFGNMCACIYCVYELFRSCIFIPFILLFNFVSYAILLLCLCILIFIYVLFYIYSVFILPTGSLRLPWLRFFCVFPQL